MSVALHGLMLAIFGIWVVATLAEPATAPPETFLNGRGGNRGTEPSSTGFKSAPRALQAPSGGARRLAAKSETGGVALPDPVSLGLASLWNGWTEGSGQKAMGGGAKGLGGQLTGPGNGSEGFVSIFGRHGARGLRGTLYDLKQTKLGKPTDAAPYPAGMKPYREAIRDFLGAGWNPGKFDRFYQAPNPLMMSQLFIPGRAADAAPKAFGVEQEVRPSRWVVHYKGMVKAPRNGTFRFVGSGDDWLIVRWNRKVVFDEGYETFAVKGGDYREVGQKVEASVPIDRAPGGRGFLKAGPWITVRKGEMIPVEILMGEGPGGVFDAYLTLEAARENKIGGDFVGEGSLKLFRTSFDPLPEEIQNPGRGLNIDMQAAGWVFEATGAPAVCGVGLREGR